MTQPSAANRPVLELAAAAEFYVVNLARLGDQHAFTELVSRRQSAIRNLLRRLSRNATLSDDLAQETFLQAWKQLPKLRAAEAFSGWLRQIAVNAWLQYARVDVKFEVQLEDVSSVSTNTMEQLDLDGALAALHPSVRLCIVLSYHEGMSHSEIANAANLPIGTVKSHITRGTSRLRELLSAYNPHSG